MKNKFTICAILLSFALEAQQTGEFVDKRDVKIYKTVVIGSQTYMAENLNVSTFRNGDPILEARTADQWIEAEKLRIPAWCYYENSEEQEDSINGSKYGMLYNFIPSAIIAWSDMYIQNQEKTIAEMVERERGKENAFKKYACSL